MDKPRVRFAPSPTGALHIGGVRTALYNYLFARQKGGTFLLRIEDTDSARFVPGAEEYIIESLRWLGIEIDEGIGATPLVDGNLLSAPYRQSERREIYEKYVQQLLDEGKAYYAFDTTEELDLRRAETPNFQYDASTRMQMKNSLTVSEEEVARRIGEGEKYVVRIKITPNEEITVCDLIRGEVKINSSIIDDKVLWKSSDHLPTYHLANIVDDHLMAITHVIRGEEWLPSAPLHVLLYRAFGWEMPQFAHLPLLLKPEGNGKLSKRDGDRLGFPVFPLAWRDPKTGEISSGYRERGFFPEAVVNFLALLGWNSGSEQEIFSMGELVENFSLERVSKSGAKFDYEKCKWFNHKYLQMRPLAEITDIFNKILIEKDIIYDSERLTRIVALMRERVNFVSELWEQAAFFFIAPKTFDEKAVQKRWKSETAQYLTDFASLLKTLPDLTPAIAEPLVMQWLADKNYNIGAVMNPLRLALVGEMKGPHIFDIVEMLGKDETLARIAFAVKTMG